jgi:hypothetical protein
LYRDQVEILTKDYKDTASLLVRILLDEYFAGRVPRAKVKMLRGLK